MQWYRRTGAGLLIRIFGLMLMALAAAATALLRARALHGSVERDPIDYFLALASFFGGTGGLTLALLGGHIYDRVEVSRRWRRLDD